MTSKRRVVVTGMGIVSCIGNTLDTVARALKEGQSGIKYAPSYKEHGFRSCVEGSLDVDLSSIPRRFKRFMGDGVAYGYLAMEDAIKDANLDTSAISSERTGVIVGAGGPSTRSIIDAVDVAREAGSSKRVGPFSVPQTMSSSAAANLSTAFQTRGVAYSLSSACATSTHCLANAADLIASGSQDLVFAGGVEELHWTLSVFFDAMGALSSRYNESPQVASRPFDAARDGFVISGGAGILVLEELEHARRRGARIYAELVGAGITSDGADMVQPSGEGALRCMRAALEQASLQSVDYINPHATSTPIGDKRELEAIINLFGSKIPPLSATKALTGHSLGAIGAQEAIFCLLMMRDGFIAGSRHIDSIDPDFKDCPIVQETRSAELRTVMSNSFGFGGTNGSLVFRRLDEREA